MSIDRSKVGWLVQGGGGPKRLRMQHTYPLRFHVLRILKAYSNGQLLNERDPDFSPASSDCYVNTGMDQASARPAKARALAFLAYENLMKNESSKSDMMKDSSQRIHSSIVHVDRPFQPLMML